MIVSGFTPEWLRAVGFEQDGDDDTPDFWLKLVPDAGGPISYLCYRPWMGCDGWTVHERFTPEGGVEVPPVTIPPIEGPALLRLFCTALGVTLKEPGDAPPEG